VGRPGYERGRAPPPWDAVDSCKCEIPVRRGDDPASTMSAPGSAAFDLIYGSKCPFIPRCYIVEVSSKSVWSPVGERPGSTVTLSGSSVVASLDKAAVFSFVRETMHSRTSIVSDVTMRSVLFWSCCVFYGYWSVCLSRSCSLMAML
jgi:hypothetical protein